MGGSWVDVKETASCLQALGCDVKLFTPLFKDYFPRGSIKTEPPFPVELIPFNRFSFNFKKVQKKFREAVDNYAPDFVIITDGYFLKPYLVEALRHYPIFMRFYAYEILCPMNNFTRWGTTLYCENNFIRDRKECLACFGRNNRYLRDAFNFIFGTGEKSSLHFFQEFVFSKAFSAGYVDTVKNALREVNGVIVYNSLIGDILKKFNPNINIMPSGINAKAFTPSERESFVHTNTGKPIVNIAMVGRANDPVKGMHILDRALSLISLHRDDFVLAVTNEAPMRARSYVRELGWLHPSALPTLYKNIDIAVIPSIWHEPFGIGALEAMASGKPVIASRVGGLQEIVEDGVTGFLVEPRDVRELSEKLELLMDNPALRKTMGEAARKRVESVYEWKKIITDKYLPMLGITL